MSDLYPLLRELHWLISRSALGIGGVMFGIAIYIGIFRKGDVTVWFRRITYVIAGVMVLEALIGFGMYALGGRPAQDVHIIYGIGTALSLPFFIFVEVTAQKRPSMGSYIWGFAMMTMIAVRSILTAT